jgi:hypothetical protein
MRLIRTHEIRLKWDGERATAFIQDPEGNLEGYGADVPAALEDLLRRIRAEGVKVWAPAWATQYRDGGRLKAVCPECGYVSEMSDFASVIAYVCEGCGEGVSVEPFEGE